MINRALTRLKTVQILYAHYMDETNTLSDSLKELNKSLEASHELYLHMLALLTDIRYYAERRAESIELRAQRLRTQLEEKPYDAYLAENKLLLMLQENKELEAFKAHRRDLWAVGDTFLKRVVDLFVQSNVMGEYVAREDHSFEADRELIRALYKQLLTENEDLEEILEEQSIYWNDDKDIVDSFVLKTIKRLNEKDNEDTPLLQAYDEGEDPEFGAKLLTAAIKRCDELREMMSERVRGWDFSRVALMDILIMQLALAEVLTFGEIPLNVTFNEYINMAKCYSTPKSGNYINGVLDSIVKGLKAEGAIMK